MAVPRPGPAQRGGGGPASRKDMGESSPIGWAAQEAERHHPTIGARSGAHGVVDQGLGALDPRRGGSRCTCSAARISSQPGRHQSNSEKCQAALRPVDLATGLDASARPESKAPKDTPQSAVATGHDKVPGETPVHQCRDNRRERRHKAAQPPGCTPTGYASHNRSGTTQARPSNTAGPPNSASICR